MSCEAVESGYGGGGVLTCAAVGFGNLSTYLDTLAMVRLS